MRHIFKLDGKGNIFDKIAFKRRLGEIMDQVSALDPSITIRSVSDLLIYWTKECSKYEHSSSHSYAFDQEINSLDRIIPILLTAKRSITTHKNRYGALCNEESTINVLNEQIHTLKNQRIGLRAYRGIIYRRSAIKSEAIFQVFRVGEGFGLKAHTKTGAGRGNKNKLYEFVRLITGLSSRDTINGYHKLYKFQKTSHVHDMDKMSDFLKTIKK